jgi:hypothetical protein
MGQALDLTGNAGGWCLQFTSPASGRDTFGYRLHSSNMCKSA